MRTSNPPSATKKQAMSPKTGMRLWLVRLRDPRHHRERKVWVTEVIAFATTKRGAAQVVRRELPELFSYAPTVTVEPLVGHAVKHLTYQAHPMSHE